MFKLVVLSVVLSIVAGKPSSPLYPLTPILNTIVTHEPGYAKVGEYVARVPTAISHQSSTIVHNRANVVTPIVAPAVKTSYAPVVSSYTAPLIHSYPASYYYPLSYGAPYSVHGYLRQQLYKQYYPHL